MKILQEKKPTNAVRPILMLVGFIALAAVVLLTMDALGSGASPVNWSWVLYGAGALALFLVYTLRERKQSTHEEPSARQETEHPPNDDDEEASETLHDVRQRIQERKKRKE
jgi:type VI protein secretion system component VasK